MAYPSDMRHQGLALYYGSIYSLVSWHPWYWERNTMSPPVEIEVLGGQSFLGRETTTCAVFTWHLLNNKIRIVGKEQVVKKK